MNGSKFIPVTEVPSIPSRRGVIASTVGLGLLAVAPAFAAADAEVATGLADALLSWTAIKTAIISVVVGLLAIGFLKKLRRA